MEFDAISKMADLRSTLSVITLPELDLWQASPIE